MHAIAISMFVLSSHASSGPAAADIARRDVSFESAGITLAATLLVPQSPKPVPAVVLVHGSGESDRSNAWTSAYADAFAARGIAVLHPDKRGSGQSKGDWKTASFDLLADDAARAVEFLRTQAGIDATNVGIAGFSQGVHIAPVCASRPKAADFVISVSGSTVPLLEQTLDEIELESVRDGAALSADQRKRVEAIHRLALAFAKTGEGWDQYQEELRLAVETPGPMVRALRGMPQHRDHWVLGWAHAVGDFDPLPYWRKVAVPMLFLYGGRDTQVKGAKSIARLRDAFSQGEHNWSVLECALNGHALFREDVLDFAARWIRDRGAP